MSKNLLDVLRYEPSDNNDTIVHKHRIDDFNAKSQLIVGESQEALFYKDGQALDLFGPGRHTLNSDNLPILKRIFAGIFGGTNPFQCEVFFINKVSVLAMMWGTDSPIVMKDPKYKLTVRVKSFGDMGIRVVDSRRFVVKVVGALDNFGIDQIKRSIKGMAMQSIKDTIAKAIINRGLSVTEISACLEELSRDIKVLLNGHLKELGLELENFHINNIEPDDSDREKIRELEEELAHIDIEAHKTVRMGEAVAAARAAQGFTYQDERKFDVMQAAAQNEGVAGTMMGAGMGVGMGFGVGGEIGKVASQAMNQVSSQEKCAECGAAVASGSKFCASCGKPFAPKKCFCVSCGAELTAGARFCSSCGAEQAPANKICPSCGTSVGGANRFCHSCGHDFTK